MSRFSGKCDLADWVSMEVQYKVNGGYTSDWLECFEEFKRKTGGVIYQSVKMNIKPHFGDTDFEWIKSREPSFDYKVNVEKKPDKRTKSGFKEVKTYTFTYFFKEYSLKEMMKVNIYIKKEIHFDTLLDLIPYFPYIVSSAASSDGKETIFISSESYVEEEENKHLNNCFDSKIGDYYRKELSNFYLEVCKDYFLKDLDSRTHLVTVKMDDLTKSENGNYILTTAYDIDYMHRVKYLWSDLKRHSHWSSPKVIDSNKIELDARDVERYLKDDISEEKLFVKFVSALERKVELE